MSNPSFATTILVDQTPEQAFRRHQQCSWRDGLSAGGLTYGYAPAGKKGERVIVEHEAAIVRRILRNMLPVAPRATSPSVSTPIASSRPAGATGRLPRSTEIRFAARES